MAEGKAADGPTPFEEKDVAGRTFLITGASGGIGAELARQLGRRKAKLVLLARREAALKDLKTSIVAGGAEEGDIDVRVCDVSSWEALKLLFQGRLKDEDPEDPACLAKTYASGIDGLVVNAGVMPGLGMPPMGVPDDHDVACFRTNLEGAHFVTKYALPLLLASKSGFGGTIVYTSSCESYLTDPTDPNGMLAYRASKAGVNGLMVASHLLYTSGHAMGPMIGGGALGRIVAVHPGYVKTALGIESERMFEPDLTPEESTARKDGDADFVSVEHGVNNTLLWALLAKDGVESGKIYEDRKAHSF